MMPRPTDDQIATALLWLRSNEGEGDEAAACAAVADWIERETLDRYLKQEARKAGVPVKKLRDALKRRVTERLRAENCGVRAI